jgi:hypothetical protein
MTYKNRKKVTKFNFLMPVALVFENKIFYFSTLSNNIEFYCCVLFPIKMLHTSLQPLKQTNIIVINVQFFYVPVKNNSFLLTVYTGSI